MLALTLSLTCELMLVCFFITLSLQFALDFASFLALQALLMKIFLQMLLRLCVCEHGLLRENWVISGFKLAHTPVCLVVADEVALLVM